MTRNCACPPMSSYPLGGKLDAAGGVEISTQFQHIDTRFSSRILEQKTFW